MSVRNAFFNLGVAFESVTKPDELTKFFDMVSPVHVGKDLACVGGVDDGGYLLPDDFDRLEACFSPGVTYDAAFEEAMAERASNPFWPIILQTVRQWKMICSPLIRNFLGIRIMTCSSDWKIG